MVVGLFYKEKDTMKLRNIAISGAVSAPPAAVPEAIANDARKVA